MSDQTLHGDSHHQLQSLDRQLDRCRTQLRRGAITEATGQIDKLAGQYPENPAVLHVQALSRAAQWRNGEAIDILEKALAMNPDHAGLHYELGLQQIEIGDQRRALEEYRLAVLNAPDHPEFRQPLAELHLRLGNFDAAEGLLRQNIQRFPDDKRLYNDLVMTRTWSAEDPLFDELESQTSDKSIPKAQRSHLHFALLKLYNDVGEIHRAFHHAVVGNRLSGRSFNHPPHRQWIDKIIASYPLPKKTSATLTPTKPHSHVPVFIVGMPRSGTTLVEQILSSHPRVFGAGESMLLGQLDREATSLTGQGRYPDYAGQLNDAHRQQLGSDYLKRLNRANQQSESTSHITDKQPLNFHLIGLIFELFPNARVIHCCRHPLDVCLSCYQQNFVSPTMNFSFDLKTLAHFYKDYQRLMEHWHARYPAQILDLSYPTLIEQPEPQTRRLLDYLGLPWDPSCLEFQKNQRSVQTASLAQVRKPLYRTSVDRWKSLAAELRPAADILGIDLSDRIQTRPAPSRTGS